MALCRSELPWKRRLHRLDAAAEAEDIAAEAEHLAAVVHGAVGILRVGSNSAPMLAVFATGGVHGSDRFPKLGTVELPENAQLLRKVAGTNEEEVDIGNRGDRVDFGHRSQRLDLDGNQLLAVGVGGELRLGLVRVVRI